MNNPEVKSENRADIFDADYFLRGKESGKSLYEDYRWMPHLTIPMVQTIVDHCRMQKGQRVMDFGCARGYTVKALQGIGFDAWGVDISEWAINNCDPVVKGTCKLLEDMPISKWSNVDWVIAKDVLEHVEYVDRVILELISAVNCGIFIVVPLSKFDGGRYVIPDYEKDVTHIQRFSLTTWARKFIRPGWSVELSFRIPGIKDNYFRPGWECGNGFITARKI